MFPDGSLGWRKIFESLFKWLEEREVFQMGNFDGTEIRQVFIFVRAFVKNLLVRLITFGS